MECEDKTHPKEKHFASLFASKLLLVYKKLQNLIGLLFEAETYFYRESTICKKTSKIETKRERKKGIQI